MICNESILSVHKHRKQLHQRDIFVVACQSLLSSVQSRGVKHEARGPELALERLQMKLNGK